MENVYDVVKIGDVSSLFVKGNIDNADDVLPMNILARLCLIIWTRSYSSIKQVAVMKPPLLSLFFPAFATHLNREESTRQTNSTRTHIMLNAKSALVSASCILCQRLHTAFKHHHIPSNHCLPKRVICYNRNNCYLRCCYFQNWMILLSLAPSSLVFMVCFYFRFLFWSRKFNVRRSKL